MGSDNSLNSAVSYFIIYESYQDIQGFNLACTGQSINELENGPSSYRLKGIDNPYAFIIYLKE